MQPVWCLFLLSAGDTWPVLVACQWKRASGGGRELEVISTFPQIDHIEFYTQKIKPIYFLLIGDSSHEPRSVLVWLPESQNRTYSLGPGFFHTGPSSRNAHSREEGVRGCCRGSPFRRAVGWSPAVVQGVVSRAVFPG